jgi:hypothetical protein
MPSSVIAQYNYDKALARLTIVFTTGRVYEYSMVPASIVANLRTAGSKGEYFNREIRGHYPYREVTPPRQRNAG